MLVASVVTMVAFLAWLTVARLPGFTGAVLVALILVGGASLTLAAVQPRAAVEARLLLFLGVAATLLVAGEMQRRKLGYTGDDDGARRRWPYRIAVGLALFVALGCIPVAAWDFNDEGFVPSVQELGPLPGGSPFGAQAATRSAAPVVAPLPTHSSAVRTSRPMRWPDGCGATWRARAGRSPTVGTAAARSAGFSTPGRPACRSAPPRARHGSRWRAAARTLGLGVPAARRSAGCVEPPSPARAGGPLLAVRGHVKKELRSEPDRGARERPNRQRSDDESPTADRPARTPWAWPVTWGSISN